MSALRSIAAAYAISTLLIVVGAAHAQITIPTGEFLFSGEETCSVTFQSAAVLDDPMCGQASSQINLRGLTCSCIGATTCTALIIRVVECDENADNCVATGLEANLSANGAAVVDNVGTDTTIDKDDFWGIHVISLTQASELTYCSARFQR